MVSLPSKIDIIWLRGSRTRRGLGSRFLPVSRMDLCICNRVLSIQTFYKIQNLCYWLELLKLGIYKFESPRSELRFKRYGLAIFSYLLPTSEKKQSGLKLTGLGWSRNPPEMRLRQGKAYRAEVRFH